ncbi:hypothetical protein [Agrobacterium vitis]|uniref:hypothetical protein n=1 Tax=Agrobacterium vitis TaxID=373 RepID=UPI003D29E10F
MKEKRRKLMGHNDFFNLMRGESQRETRPANHFPSAGYESGNQHARSEFPLKMSSLYDTVLAFVLMDDFVVS